MKFDISAECGRVSWEPPDFMSKQLESESSLLDSAVVGAAVSDTDTPSGLLQKLVTGTIQMFFSLLAATLCVPGHKRYKMLREILNTLHSLNARLRVISDK